MPTERTFMVWANIDSHPSESCSEDEPQQTKHYLLAIDFLSQQL